MPSSEDILLTIMANDQTSGVTNNINKNIQSMGTTATQSINSMNSGFMQLNQGATSLVSGLTGGKSVSELIMGNTNKAETNKALLSMMSSTQGQADKLYSHVDDVTNNSLVSMQNLIPALNAFKTATGATDEEIYNATEGIANFGAKVQAQTGSTALAETAMMNLSKGIKGACASLDQYGITEDALKRTGKWSGEEDDINGFIAAVEELTGDTSALMDTNEGLSQKLQKQFSIAGKSIGNTFLPQIKDLKKGLLSLNTATGGNLFAGILVGAQALEVANSVMMPIGNIINGTKQIAGGLKEAVSFGKQLKDKLTSAADAGSKLAETGTNISEMGANASQTADIAPTTVDSSKASTEVPEVDFSDLYGDSDSIDVKKSKNYEKYLEQVKENKKSQKVLTDALEKGTIDEGTYNKLSKSIQKDRDNLAKVFEESGDIANVGWGKGSNKQAKKFVEEFGKQDDLLLDMLGDNLDDGTSSKKINQLKEQVDLKKKNLTDTLLSDMDVDLDLDTKKKGKGLDVDDIAGGVLDVGDDVADVGKKVDKVDDVADVGKKVGKVADGATDVAEAGAGLAGSAGAATTASAGAGTFAGAFSGFGASLGAMLAPMLMVSAAVAVMIPVVVALAAEALLFIRGLMEVVKALDFGSCDLSGAITGLKQIASAMVQLGVAMMAVTAVSILSQINKVVSFFGLLGDPVKQAVTQLKKAAGYLKQFGAVHIDESVSTNLKTIATSLNAVSGAMLSLTGTTITKFVGDVVTLGGRLGTLTGNLSSVKNDLLESVNILNSFTGISGVDEGVASKLKSLSEALGAVATAFGSMTDVSWDASIANILPIGDLVKNLEAVKGDLIDAVPVVNSFKGISAPDEEASNNLKKLATALKSLSEAMKALQSLPSGWDTLAGDIVEKLTGFSAIKSATSKLKEVAGYVAPLTSLPTIQEGTATKITNIANALKPIKNSIGVLNTIDIPAWTNTQMLVNLRAGIPKIKTVANILQQFNGIATVQPGLATKVLNVANGVKPVKQAITSLNSTSIPTWSNTQMLVNLRSAVAKIKTVANVLTQFNGVQAVSSGVASKITNITNAVKPVKTAMTTLNSMTIPSWSNSSIITNLRTAITNLKNVVTALNQFNSIAPPTATSTILPQVKTALVNLRNVLTTINSGGFVAPNIAGVTSAVAGVKNIITQLNSLAGSNLAQVGSLLTSVNTALSQLKAVLSASAGGFYSAGSQIGLSIVNGVRAGMSGLSSAVTSAVSSAISAGVSIGTSGGSQIGQAITNGFKSGLSLSDVMSAEMDYVVDAVNSGIDAAKSAAQSGAQEVVQAFKDGVNSGSPGDIAWTMYDEMGYTNDFIISGGKTAAKSSKLVGQNIVDSFGSPGLAISSLEGINKPLQVNNNKAVETLVSTAPQKQDNRPVVLNIQEGAVKLDARNLTTKESKQVMINALEGMDCINNVNIRGIGA